MHNRRHHYVPRFYLAAFQSASDRLHLYHFSSQRAFKDASLRKQCYRHRFYGKSEDIENRLARLEADAASVLRVIRASGQAPAIGTREYATLLTFVALQDLRTPVARQKVKELSAKMDDQVFGTNDPAPESGIERFSPMDDDEALRLHLMVLPQYATTMSDLQLHVAHTSAREKLITSDNPVFKYNSYCRAVQGWGVLGADSPGLQIFLPLGPTDLLLLYDGDVYNLEQEGKRRSRTLGESDVRSLNSLQILNSEHCVFFSEWSDSESIRRLSLLHRPRKQGDAMKVEEVPEAGSTNKSIVHSWEALPDLPFLLPFSRLRWQARKIPPQDRANHYRSGALAARDLLSS